MPWRGTRTVIVTAANVADVTESGELTRLVCEVGYAAAQLPWQALLGATDDGQDDDEHEPQQLGPASSGVLTA